MINIALDMMGGDLAPEETVNAAINFLNNTSHPVFLTMVGDKIALENLISTKKIISKNFTIVHAPETIGMHEHPTKALKEKKQSSIAIGFYLLANKKVDAFISAGNTGAMLVGSIFTIKTIEGVLRPAIPTILPRLNGTTGLLLDVGLNADCKPENLVQFAIMGSVYAQQILGIQIPRVALLNVGEEEGKGNVLTQAAYSLLKQNKNIEFIGNAEGRDIFTDKADVIVCDGFTGNIILKMAESFYTLAQHRNINDSFINRFNFEQYGGVPILGVHEPVIIGHGISKANAFEKMIELSQQMIEKKVLEKMKNKML